MTQQITETIIPTELGRSLLRTRCSHVYITDEMVSKKARQAVLHSGDVLLVQCFDRTDDQNSCLEAEAEYRIIKRKSGPKMIEKPDGSMHQEEAIDIDVEMWSDGWRTTKFYEAAPTTGVTSRWNFGKKGYDIFRDDQVIGFEKDKAAAEQKVSASGAM